MGDLLIDDFNRANSAVSPGSPSVGGPYTAVTGVWGINANALYTTTSAVANHLTFPGAVDIDITFDLSAFSASGGGPIFRRVDANNMWGYLLTANEIIFQRCVAGTWVNVSRTPVLPTFIASDVFRVHARGEMLYGYINGMLALTQRDWFYGNGASVAGFNIRNTGVRINNVLAVDGLSSTPLSDGFLQRGRLTKAEDVEGVI